MTPEVVQAKLEAAGIRVAKVEALPRAPQAPEGSEMVTLQLGGTFAPVHVNVYPIAGDVSVAVAGRELAVSTTDDGGELVATVREFAGFPRLTSYQRMTVLARSFPGLEHAPVEPFNATTLDNWARGLAHGHLCAVSFVLSVWSGTTGAGDVKKKKASDRLWCWTSPRFDLHEALGVWDAKHRAAFLAWAAAPWWP